MTVAAGNESREKGQRKNVLFIITSLYGGGAEKVCCLLASAMAKRHNVTVGYMEEKEESYPLDAACEKVKLDWTAYGGRNPVKKAYFLMKNVSFCRKLKKSRNIDVTISMLLPANRLNVLSKRGDMVITSERANPRKYLPEKFRQTEILYGLSDHVVFQSQAVRSLFGKRVRDKSSIIMNPVSVLCKAEKVRKHRIVTMGRLSEQKNHKMLIKSFAGFLKEYPDYTLSLYGEGELKGELIRLADKLEIGKSVIFEGNVPDVHEKIKDAEIFVLSSDYEGLSNALLECMAMGIACISTKCEGSADVIRDGENGLLTPVGDGEALTEAMKLLAGNADLRNRLEKNAPEDMKELTAENIVRKWEDLFSRNGSDQTSEGRCN